MNWTKTATQQTTDRMAWQNLLNAIKDVRPAVGAWYDFEIDFERVRGKVLANYPHFTLFQDARGWKFCLTPWEVRRYAA